MLVQQEPKVIYNAQPFSHPKFPVLLLSFAGLDLCKALCRTMLEFSGLDMQVVNVTLLTELISIFCNRKHVFHMFLVVWELSNCCLSSGNPHT